MRRQGSRMDRRAHSSRDDARRDRRRSRSRSRPRSRRRRERSRSRSREREPPRSGGWGAPPPSTGWGAPPVAQQGSTPGGWAAPPPLAPVVARPAAPKKNAEDVLREFVTNGTCCTEANPRCPISRRMGLSHHFPEATREEDCNDKGWKLKSVKALYCHCRSRSESGEHYHKVVLFVHGVDC